MTDELWVDRRTVLKRMGMAAGMVAAWPLLQACGDDDDPSGSPVSSSTTPAAGTTPAAVKTLIVVDGETPLSQDWDGAASVHAPSLAGFANIHDFLVDYKSLPQDGFRAIDFTDLSSLTKGANNVQSRLAERWEVEPDGSAITFFLRSGVMSRFGNELTAEDVRWSFERSFSREGISAFVLGAAGIDNIDSLQIIDPSTVKVNFSGPTAYFWNLIISTYATVIDSTEAKKHATGSEPYADTWIHENGGSFGPYEITSRTEGSEVVFEARPDYYLGPAKISRIVWRQVPDSSSRLALLERGAADTAFRMDPKDIDAAQNSENVKTFAAEGNFPLHIEANFEAPPLGDIRVRQAIAYAIPYDDILQTVFFGQGRRWRGVIADIFDGYTDEGWDYDTDLDKARSLLAEAGFDNGTDLPALTYRADNEIQQQTALLMQTSLSDAGMRFDLDEIPGSVLDDRKINAKDIPWFIGNTEIPLVPDVGYSLELFFVRPGTSSSFGGFQNSIHYENDEIDQFAKDMRVETDPDKRRQVGFDAQKILARDLPHIPIAQQGEILPVRQNVSGYIWYPVTQHHFYEWDKE